MGKAIDFINNDEVWSDLTDATPDSSGNSQKHVRLKVHRIINGFALPEEAKKKDDSPVKKARGLAAMQERKVVEVLPGVACPLAGRSIWLTIEADAGKSTRGSQLKQLIEVELTMKNSLEARVLSKILDLTTAEELQEKVVIGAKRRRAPHIDGL